MDVYYYSNLAGTYERIIGFRSHLHAGFYITYFIERDFFLLGTVRIENLEKFNHWLRGAKLVLEPTDDIYIGGKRLRHLNDFVEWLDAVRLIVENKEYQNAITCDGQS